MKYIEDKLNSIGPVSYTAYPPDGSDPVHIGGDHDKHHYTVSATACLLTATLSVPSNNQTVISYVSLRDVSKITVGLASTLDVSSLHYRYEPDPSQLLVMMRTASVKVTSTHPDFDFKVDKKHPVAPMVTETTPLRKGWLVEFDDADAADRTAKALMHAVELCGGAQKKELF
jgi:hypothetical protein